MKKITLRNCIEIFEKLRFRITKENKESKDNKESLKSSLLSLLSLLSIWGCQRLLLRMHPNQIRFSPAHKLGCPPYKGGRKTAKAVRDLPGKIYIHCHHGKHRSAAAAATACVTEDTLDPA